ncbi:hypothetical protein A9168_09570 [Macellibacteroides sp. HH-ZS]|nr:hypothetical protein A9168_09570 [Macellibacteroides sp. HH-ZS]
MSKTFKFKIENEKHEWDNQFISGAEVRAIPPGIPSNMDLFIKRHGRPGELVENDQQIDLDESGIEKFYSQVANSTPGE